MDFDPKTKRLLLEASFMEADIARSFPSRRFSPKLKMWQIPLIAANLRHLDETQIKHGIVLTDAAAAALVDFATLTQAPKLVPFPRHLYNGFGKMSPFPHQERMMDNAWGLSAFAWFAEMGTGKTFGGIHTALARWKAGLIDAVVIVCPSTLRRTWQKELAKYAPPGSYDFCIHDTKSKATQAFYQAPGRGEPRLLKILAVSVEGLGVSEALYDSVCGFYPGRRVFTIVDESSRIKNPKALRTQRTIQLGAVSDFRAINNGTPIALGIQDLWSQYEFLDPNIIGSGDYHAFKARYVIMGGFEQRKVQGYQNVSELMGLIRPYTTEVRKRDVLRDLPDKVMKVVEVEPTPEQKRLFKLIIKGSTGDANEPIIKVENVLERMLRLRQVVGGSLPNHNLETGATVLEPLNPNPKFNALLELVDANKSGSKFIIWTTFVQEIELIRDELARIYGGNAVEAYYGKTGMDARSRIEDRYCNDRDMRFIVCNPVAAGLGLTLISGENDILVYYSGTSAYIDRAQSEDRAHRIGQKNSVVVIDMVMKGTVDEIIQAAIAQKMDIDQFVKEQMKRGQSMQEVLEGQLVTI